MRSLIKTKELKYIGNWNDRKTSFGISLGEQPKRDETNFKRGVIYWNDDRFCITFVRYVVYWAKN